METSETQVRMDRVRSYITSVEAQIQGITHDILPREINQFIPDGTPPLQGVTDGGSEQHGHLVTIGSVNGQWRFLVYSAVEVDDGFGNVRRMASKSQYVLLSDCDPFIQLGALNHLQGLAGRFQRLAVEIAKLVNVAAGEERPNIPLQSGKVKE